MSTTTHRTPGETFVGYTQLVTEVCPTCGVSHAIPEHMRDQKREHGEGGIYCPNGHTYGWHVSEAERLRKRLEREQQALAHARREREEARRREQAQRAAATRARNERNRARKRSADGVCPCCGRTFKQVVAHMARMHPDFDPMAVS